jgi:hypothetical protein
MGMSYTAGFAAKAILQVQCNIVTSLQVQSISLKPKAGKKLSTLNLASLWTATFLAHKYLLTVLFSISTQLDNDNLDTGTLKRIS